MKFKKLLACTLGLTIMAGTIFTGCGINESAALVKINDGEETISLGYANFVAKFAQASYEKLYNGYFGESMWSTDLYGLGTTFEDDIKSTIKDELEEQYLCVKHADDYGVSLTDEEKKAVTDAADAFIAANDAKTLKVMSASKENVEKYLTDMAITKKVQAAVKEEANITVTKDEAWQRTFTYVLYKMSEQTDASGNTSYPTQEFIDSQKAAAEAVAAAESFDTATADIDENNVVLTTYVYTKGETEDSTIDMAVIEAAEALKEGQVSSVIEVPEVGYYVIRLDSEYDEDATNDKMEDLKLQKEKEAFTAKKDEWLSAITWDFDNSQWSKIKFDSMFTFETSETTEN